MADTATLPARYADQNAKRRLRRASDRAERDARDAVWIREAVARAQTRQREIRIVRLPGGNMPLGALAGADTVHPFVPDGHTGTSCMACFGWSNDYRHTHRVNGANRG
ncbi:MAG: hypothetical protein JWO11_4474 [Nocardioides sp.]|nr:hypothetical protein [Nocardioides sp.]